MFDEIKEADTFNEATIKVEIDILHYGWFDRLFRRPRVKVFEVRQPPVGVLFQIGAAMSKIKNYEKGDTSEILPDIIDRLKTDIPVQIEVMAMLLECKASPSQRTINLINDNVTTDQIFGLVAKLFEFANLSAFLNTTILTRGMGLKRKEIIALSGGEEEKISGELLTEHVSDTDGHFTT